jgi:hypothetical protein
VAGHQRTEQMSATGAGDAAAGAGARRQEGRAARILARDDWRRRIRARAGRALSLKMWFARRAMEGLGQSAVRAEGASAGEQGEARRGPRERERRRNSAQRERRSRAREKKVGEPLGGRRREEWRELGGLRAGERTRARGAWELQAVQGKPRRWG